ncbi:alpha/beta hydrolase family protein [Noviluteimonas gilva]|uniref:Prolyl oligopeptidase family serine peptidase n=1 Tax=Noviluteimonas gilva TaxID=2682097 RepID=A0A7C9HWW8_9GAMM|nr:S9 family peptidase [Lysobacter gilvus]MUV15558.1 prolyl oligopeptidase family serine peptidase [Lysobacter gilvus]
MKSVHSILALALLAALPALAHAERGFEVRDLAKLDRVSAPVLSPDGRKVVFAKRVVDFAANKSATSLWIEDLFARDAAPPVRLTPEGWSVNSATFSDDGTRVYFLSAKGGSMQLYSIAVAGGTPVQLTDLAVDVGGYVVSPDGKRVALALEVFADCKADLQCNVTRSKEREERKASGVVFDRLFIRHWDAWNEGKLNRVFVAPFAADGAKITQATLVGSDVIGDVPSRPFGDTSEMAWSPDGKSLVLSARKADNVEPWSTNFDLYMVNADGTGAAKNLTAANKAWDTNPVFANDGKTLYYRAMKRPGFEADRFALMAMDPGTGSTREIASKWDASANGILLSEDGKSIYTTAEELGQAPLFSVDIASGEVTSIIKDGTVTAVDLAGPTLVYTRNSLQSGDQLFAAQPDGATPRAITQSAGEMVPDVKFGEATQFKFAGWNNETVHGYVVKPWNYQPGKKYPVAFLIHGGPQGSFGNGWSYRWNPQTYAGQGYAVVMIDFHGSTGYGQAFTDAISQHWGDRPLEDLQKGWDAALKQFDFLDGSKACALGASYGGFMVNWIAGNWNAPWKCLVSHDGVFDQRMMGYATEELWFSEWENGGTPFEHPENYERFNPVNHVKDWKKPILVVHGQLDFRIPVEQGIGAFTAAQRQGIESKFLYFPDENHWVLKPQNSVLWHDTVNAWLKQHIGQ